MEILLVEDSDAVSCITQEFLLELGHEVVAVVSAELALQHLSSHVVDAVMTDVRLPGMSGLALAKELAVTHPKLPVIISSGYGALSVQSTAGKNSENTFVLPKPYDMEALQRTLDAVAAYAATAPGKTST